MLSFLRRQWFLLALLGAVAVGALWPEPIAWLSRLPGLRSGVVAVVLFLMGITVPARAFGHAFRAPGPGLLALGFNVIGVPLVAVVFARWLPRDLAGGLIVAAAVPCTLASALAWTRRGGGNEVVPMMVMLITNTLCFVIAPLTLWLLLGTAVELDLAGQVQRLALLVVTPLILAALLRLRAGVAAAADRHKHAITQVALGGILLMVSFGAAATYRQATGQPTPADPPGASIARQPSTRRVTTYWLGVTAVAAAATHAIVLAAAWGAAALLGMPRRDRVAVAIAGSQKTLMVGLQISLDCGVSAIPMTLYHAAQLLIDTVLVSHQPQRQTAPEQHQP